MLDTKEVTAFFVIDPYFLLELRMYISFVIW